MRKRHTTSHPGITYRLVDESKPDGPRRYIVGYSDSNGDWHTKTLPLGASFEDAKIARGKLQTKKAEGESLIPSRQTVAELLNEWLEDRAPSLAPTTVTHYRWAINSELVPAFGKRKVAELSPSDVARLISSMKQKGFKTWSVKKVLTPLQGAYSVAIRNGVVQSSPASKLLPHERPKKDQKEMRCLSRDEIQKLLSATSSTRWKALFTVLVFTGLRIGEALALRWEDVSETSITVKKSKTKAGEREVILIPAVRSVLSAWKLQQAPGIEQVFAARQGASCGYTTAREALIDAEEKAGIPFYSLHELRHTFASILIAQGELPTLVARQMGHTDPSITMKTYAHLFEEQESVDAARERLQAAMGGLV